MVSNAPPIKQLERFIARSKWCGELCQKHFFWIVTVALIVGLAILTFGITWL